MISKRGFSLLEILLVIAVIAIFAAIGLNYYQKRSESNKIERAANEMQQFMQAVNSFYIQYNHWPAKTGETEIISTEFEPFLPIPVSNERALNPWGNPYVFDGEVKLDPVEFQQSKQKFVLKSLTPDASTAKRLAALLPFGSVSSENPRLVLYYSPLPGVTTSDFFDLKLSEFNLIETKKSSFVNVICEQGWEPQAFSFLNSIDSELYKYKVKGFDVAEVKLIKDYTVTHKKAPDGNRFNFEVSYVGGCYTGLQGKGYYDCNVDKATKNSVIAYCVRPQ